MKSYSFLFPSSYINQKQPDENFADEYKYLKDQGFDCVLYNSEKFDKGIISIDISKILNKTIIYRGWMLNKNEYNKLCNFVETHDAKMMTSLQNYLLCHHLPNWYELLKDYTPETIIIEKNDNIEKAMTKLGGKKFFIKDFVKSVTENGGSIVENQNDINRIILSIEKYKGEIEGGLCIRKYENFITNTEERYFVLNNHIFKQNNEEIPQIVYDITNKISSPFYSIDIIKDINGNNRLVEIGDGQVSGIKKWNIEDFINIFQSLNNNDLIKSKTI